MEKETNEKSLTKVNNGFFSKIRKFWSKMLWKTKLKRNNGIISREENMVEDYIPEEKFEINKERKLFNYDAEYTEIEEETQDMQQNENNQEGTMEEIQNNVTENNIENQAEDDITVYKTVDVNDDDENVTYLFEKKNVSAAEEREELERKLMNYYQSIKPGI